MADQIFASDGGHFTFTPSLWVIPCEYPDKLRDRMFIRLDKTPKCDGKTDRQKCFRYYSAMHCKQRRRTAKKCSPKMDYSYRLLVLISI